ncbi:MAG: hypothetical protein HY226_01480 [Candidatus Vogelbacteria bacterium]|nr:hypothetical protein [Candidatus Vogelbacteria bacterium]
MVTEIYKLETGSYCSLAREDQSMHDAEFPSVGAAIKEALNNFGVGQARVINLETKAYVFFVDRIEMLEYLEIAAQTDSWPPVGFTVYGGLR